MQIIRSAYSFSKNHLRKRKRVHGGGKRKLEGLKRKKNGPISSNESPPSPPPNELSCPPQAVGMHTTWEA